MAQRHALSLQRLFGCCFSASEVGARSRAPTVAFGSQGCGRRAEAYACIHVELAYHFLACDVGRG
jgi:hypothetical protein